MTRTAARSRGPSNPSPPAAKARQPIRHSATSMALRYDGGPGRSDARAAAIALAGSSPSGRPPDRLPANGLLLGR